MTADKHLKQLVRARMAATGEPYATARARLRDAETHIALADPLVVDVHGRHGQTVTFTPDGTRVLSGGQDAQIAIIDAASGAVEGRLVGHSKVVNAVAVPADARTVVSVSSDQTVRTWDCATRSPRMVMTGHRNAVVALDLSPDGHEAVTGGYDGVVRRWDLARGTCLHEAGSDLTRIAAVVYTPDGLLTVESGQGPIAYVREVASGRVIAQLDCGSPAVTGLAVAPDGAMVATAGYDGTVILWACDDWEPVRRLAAGNRAGALCFSQSGQLLAAAAAGRITAWSSDSTEPVAMTDLPITGVYGLAISADGRRLAQTGADGKVRTGPCDQRRTVR